MQCCPFTIIDLESLGKEPVINKSCYKETILQRNSRKMVIFLKFLCKIPWEKIWGPQNDCVISESVFNQGML